MFSYECAHHELGFVQELGDEDGVLDVHCHGNDAETLSINLKIGMSDTVGQGDLTQERKEERECVL